MRLGIDIQSARGAKTGIGYYTKSLIDAYNRADDIECITYENTNKDEFNTIERLFWENITLPSLIRRNKPDILHIPGFAGPIIKGSLKKITTVHDLIGIIYPENLAPISRFYWQEWLPACVRNSDFIIADSKSTKNDIVSILGFPADRIEIIYLAADKEFHNVEDKGLCRKKLSKLTGIEGPFLLAVSTIEPRKNFSALVKAYSLCDEAFKKEFKIVIAGKKSWGFPALKKLTEDLKLDTKVIFLDYVDTEALLMLYNCATAFVFPSIYEGFGLPVLEAFSCGTPVIASSSSSIPEITKKAALLFKPDDIDSLKGHISKVTESKDIQKELSIKGLERAKDFSWAETAAKTIEVYRKVYNG